MVQDKKCSTEIEPEMRTNSSVLIHEFGWLIRADFVLFVGCRILKFEFFFLAYHLGFLQKSEFVSNYVSRCPHTCMRAQFLMSKSKI